MIEVRQALTRKEQKEFLEFPLDLYRDCPYFAPPLYMDEKKIFRKDYVYYDTSEAVYFNAYRDGEMVGRISGILQNASNEKWGQKRVRFTRFDAIDDQEVAKALFDAVEAWAKDKGMEEVVGPLGFSDMEREGLLIDGFEWTSTFEEQYNFPYYQKLIEGCGYAKEVDWLERRIYPIEKEEMEKMDRVSEKLMKRYNLHLSQAKNASDFIRKYGEMFFRLVDDAYEEIYGTVPFTDGMRKMMIDNFRLVIDLRFVGIILDENENPVCFGLCFPAIGEALQKSQGRLTPAAIARVLKAIKHPKVIDLALIGVTQEWGNRGVAVTLLSMFNHMIADNNVEYAETNLNLEDNHNILNMWKRFPNVQHKKRRSFVKKLG